ncbi:MAG: shikimate dehydrogenase [Clostridia bacterium]|nr:shikimate dehydrogenase [Clostridia bacterium]
MHSELIYGCIGEHLPHSFSREIHGEIGSYAYELKELTPEELPGFMTSRGFMGINVTIPYKQAVIPFLDEIDETARAIGAVNTVVNRDGKLYGYNTDLYGLTRLIRRIGLDLSEKKVLVLGTGGTSRTASYAAEKLGARVVYRVSRTSREGSLSYEDVLRDHTDAQIILNTTPCGMFPRPAEQPLSLESFTRLEGVADAIYNPLRSRLVLDARSRGIPAEGGLYMLVAQAVRASELFLNMSYPDDLTDQIYDRILRRKENLVLIGMPGSGKSAVGKILTETTGKPLADTDQLIVEKAGKSIPEIFREDGEPAFRDLESEIIRELSLQGGQVISTGGGAVLRPENVTLLRQNGRLFWLDRAPDSLVPTDDRPLADTAAKMKQLYQEREPVYRASADMIIPVFGTPEDTASLILQQ